MNPFIPEDAMTCFGDLGRFLDIAGGCLNTCWSIKKDGVRTLSVVHKDGEVAHFSRNKKRFPNFGCFDDGLRELARHAYESRLVNYPVVFDSEVTSKSEQFKDVMSQLRRQVDIDPSVFHMNIMDVVMRQTPFCKRQNALQRIFSGRTYPNMGILPHVPFEREMSAFEIDEMLDKVIENGEEGLVLKTLNGFYEHKQSRLWCKMKGEETADVPVLGYEIAKSGKYNGVIGALIVDFNGVKVNVSGMTDAQRVEFMTDTPKMIEIRYQQVTPAGSLRHPRFYRVREDK